MRKIKVSVSPSNNGKGSRTFRSVGAAKKHADNVRASGKRGKLKIKISN